VLAEGPSIGVADAFDPLFLFFYNTKLKTQNSFSFLCLQALAFGLSLFELLTVESKPRKKIGFTVKEKHARYGKQGNRQNEGNA